MDLPDVMKQKWDRTADWHLLLPPSRPSPHHLQLIRERLDAVSREVPVGVLGSTPEFRDLLASLKFRRIFVFERSVAFHDSVRRLRCYDNHEIVVWGDWLETLPQHHGKFGALLSDLTSGNVVYEDRRRFYAAVAGALAPGGLFIDKILTNEAPLLELDDLDQKYATLPFNLLTLNDFSAEYFFASRLLELKRRVDVNEFYGILMRRFENPVLLRFLQDCPSLTPRGGLWYYGMPWVDLDPLYCPGLVRIAQYPEPRNSLFFGRLRLFVSCHPHVRGGEPLDIG